jgi:hypothetical protein
MLPFAILRTRLGIDRTAERFRLRHSRAERWYTHGVLYRWFHLLEIQPGKINADPRLRRRERSRFCGERAAFNRRRDGRLNVDPLASMCGTGADTFVWGEAYFRSFRTPKKMQKVAAHAWRANWIPPMPDTRGGNYEVSFPTRNGRPVAHKYPSPRLKRNCIAGRCAAASFAIVAGEVLPVAS